MASCKNFLKLLGCKTPIVGAPMAGPSGGALAAQITLGGGFGFMAAGYQGIDSVKRELHIAQTAFQQNGQSSNSEYLHIGVGFLAWKLDELGEVAVSLISAVLEQEVTAVWLAFGDNIGRWVEFVRDFDRRRTKKHKTLIFVQVGSVEDAQTAVNDWKVDVLAVQGIESGGHGYKSAPPLFTLVSEVLQVLPEGFPILAAGGLVLSSHIASILALGAAGAVLGTRFLLTPESLYTASQKQALLQARSADATVRTYAFDQVRGTLGWPGGIDGRAIRNQTVANVEGGMDIAEARVLFDEATKQGDRNGMLVWAGMGVGQVTEIKGAAEIVRELDAGIKSCLAVAREALD